MDSGIPLVHSADYYMFLCKLFLIDVVTSNRKKPSISSSCLYCSPSCCNVYTNHPSKYELTTLLHNLVQGTLNGLVYYILCCNQYWLLLLLVRTQDVLYTLTLIALAVPLISVASMVQVQ